MSDISLVENNKRFIFSWVPQVFTTPRRIFQKIAKTQKAIWLTPLLIISCLVLINVLVTGSLKYQATMSGEISYPPDFQYYSPEQQAQYMQAIQSTQGPVFIYVLPGIASLLSIWFGWLILGGLLHLITTLLGGRGNTSFSMNIVAWGSLPLGLRALIQTIYMLLAHKLINNPGLSGFAPPADSGALLFLTQILRLIDVYIIWQIVLIILGVHFSTRLSTLKSIVGSVIAILIILLLQSGFSYAGSMLSDLSITRPFFF